MKHDVLVLGAGMVGTCTALHLRQRGHAVALVDRHAPGQATSHGNAGIIQREAVAPYAFPRSLGKLLAVLFKRGADVNYHLSALPGAAPGLVRYWRNSGPARYPAIAAAYASLIEHATSEHAPLISAAGAEDLVRREGYLHVYRDPATLDAAVRLAHELADRHGLNQRPLDAAALAATEPALRPGLAGAVHWQDPWTVSDPGELVKRYARHFQHLGGSLLTGDALSLKQTADGWSVATADGPVEAGQAVVALGPWSDALLGPMGYPPSLLFKRGYHQHYAAPRPPRLPLLDADRGLVLAPMQRGVRLTTGAEFARRDAPATPWQLARAESMARELLDLGPPVDPQPWLGARPCTPQMKPLIGPAPRHRGLWFNFGHGHQGFTLGPISGRLVAEMVDGDRPCLDVTPFSPQGLHAG